MILHEIRLHNENTLIIRVISPFDAIKILEFLNNSPVHFFSPKMIFLEIFKYCTEKNYYIVINELIHLLKQSLFFMRFV